MFNSIFIYSVILFFLTFFFRASIALTCSTEFDLFAHIYLSYEIKRQKSGPLGSIVPQVVGASELRHPFFWHWLISFFSIKWILNYGRWIINPLIDSLFSVTIYYFVVNLGFTYSSAFYASIMYIATPMWNSKIIYGIRAGSLTPRLFSDIFVSLFFMFTILPLHFSPYFLFIGGAVCAFVVITSSKFGIQALLLLTPIVSIFSFAIMPILSLLFAFISAIILSDGNFLHALKFQICHLVWYYKKNKNKSMPVSSRNKPLKQIISWNYSKSITKNILCVIYKFANSNPFIEIIIKMPVLIIALMISFRLLLSNKLSGCIIYFAPLFAAIIIFFIVNIPLFLFLGEPERYLYSIAFFIVFSVAIYAQSKIIFVLLSMYGLIYWMIEVFIFSKYKPISDEIRHKEEIDKKIIKWLDDQNKTLNILCYPYHAVGVFRIMLFTKHKVLFPLLCDEKWKKEFSSIEENYPYVKLEQFNVIEKKYNINCLILSKNALVQKLDKLQLSFGWEKVLKDQSIYDIYIKTIPG